MSEQIAMSYSCGSPPPPNRSFPELLEVVQEAGEDFEWYPTTDRMIAAVARHIPARCNSIMDIGAGDGRVLLQLAKKCEYEPKLYAIEKSIVLIQAQPENVVPVGTDLFEQNLACLPVEYIFCNPPYSQFEAWASLIIESGHARHAFLVIPRRWKESEIITAALKRRGVTARVIHSDDFQNADRRARAVVDIVEIDYPRKTDSYREDDLEDPFDAWFDQNINTFDAEAPSDYHTTEELSQKELARIRQLSSITEMVGAFNEEYARMEDNYKAIFRLDYALLKELGVNKNAVRDGIKVKMAGLKTKYWTLLFERLDAITTRLSTATKKSFLEKLTGRTALAFTESNAYAVVIWSIKNANKYFDEQTVQLFRDLSTFEGVLNYKSNVKTWEKTGWRFNSSDHSNYALDYRIVVSRYGAIDPEGKTWNAYNYPGGLATTCHELIADTLAVLYNLGFQAYGANPLNRQWTGGEWQDWQSADSRVLFQVKAYKNGNLHFRFMPDAIKALNIEAGRLLGWLHNREDVETELGYTAAEATRFFGCTKTIAPSNIRLLGAGGGASC